MELDLWIAIGFIAAISGLALIAGRRLSLSVYRNRPLLFAECLVFSLVFAFGLSNRLSWASVFPTSAPLHSAEQLMSDACLTSTQGTSSLGLVRDCELQWPVAIGKFVSLNPTLGLGRNASITERCGRSIYRPTKSWQRQSAFGYRRRRPYRCHS